MEIQQYDELTFENIKHIDENGVEFCYDIQAVANKLTVIR
jgi:hypothetical protein